MQIVISRLSYGERMAYDKEIIACINALAFPSTRPEKRVLDEAALMAAEATGDFYCEGEQIRHSLKCQRPCKDCWSKTNAAPQGSPGSTSGNAKKGS